MNVKKKGNIWENKLSNWLRDNGIKAWKDGASGGGSREKADVGNNLNLHIESKAVKSINLQKVWKKAELECQKTHNSPVIAIHFDGMRDNEWLITIHSEDWLDLLKSSQEAKIKPGEIIATGTSNDDREQKYRITRAISVLKDLLKTYE